MTRGPEEMPALGTKYAPNFDPRYPEELEDFLEDFEDLARQYGLTKGGMSRMVVRYTDGIMRRFWKALEGYGEDYRILKEAIWEQHEIMYGANKRPKKERKKVSANGQEENEEENDGGPSGFDNDTTITNDSDVQSATVNKLAYKGTQTSSKLTVLAQNSSAMPIVIAPAINNPVHPFFNADAVIMSISDNQITVEGESEREEMQTITKHTCFTQEYPTYRPGTHPSTAFNVRMPMIKPNDDGMGFESDKVENLEQRAVEGHECGADFEETRVREEKQASDRETGMVENEEVRKEEDMGGTDTHQSAYPRSIEIMKPDDQHYTQQHIPDDGIPCDNVQHLVLFSKDLHKHFEIKTHTANAFGVNNTDPAHLEPATFSGEAKVQEKESQLEEELLTEETKNANVRNNLPREQEMELGEKEDTITEIANVGMDMGNTEDWKFEVDWTCTYIFVILRPLFKVLLEIPWWKGV
ncbi:hypothetical protein BYT27DRAFT_7218607 [Phlegmacium glaucopus]|nr:hypothetical protein BYT27DRAFT_7218607 [Phlegmacium glaucopus]